MPQFVDIETPYSARTEGELRRNIRYARACVRDSILKGEFPFASHLFYTQSGILDDNIQEERDRGIMAGKEIISHLKATTAVYTDLGTSKGMQLGINLAKEQGRNIDYRTLGKDWDAEFSKHERSHSHNNVW
ncbi:MAG: hypothetical protein AABW79_00525 [Nanoarchaeota archaeon]